MPDGGVVGAERAAARDGGMDPGSLAGFLRSRRERLDPRALGIVPGRRRTAGLRREEVAARAGISATWYTWLEQGRGGAPSAGALERIGRALCLSAAEREHLFLLGLGRPAEVRYRGPEGVPPRLQRLLDALDHSPALVRTAAWDVVGWNRAATAVFGEFAAVPPEGRNILRRMFGDPAVRGMQADWEGVARFVVAAFRLSVARAGAEAEVAPLVAELSRSSPEFVAMWRENDVREHGDEVKRLLRPAVGWITLEYSAFAVEGRPELGLIVYQPATEEDRAKIGRLMRNG